MSLSENQERILAYMVKLPGKKTTAHVFNELCGNSRTVRSLFSKGFVQGDDIPARYVFVTEDGLSALAPPAPVDGVE